MVDVPFRVFGAGAYDSYRKPGWGTWLAVEKLFHDDGVVIGRFNQRLVLVRQYLNIAFFNEDKSSSYFVGDAAGRVGDHDSTDRKYALNVGLPFFTPEVQAVAFLPHMTRLFTAVHLGILLWTGSSPIHTSRISSIESSCRQ
jgi:bifunctional polynucleotide phosphatase/kinase